MSDFADALQQYVSRSTYSAGQLSRLTGIPKPTILSWLDGRVKSPRSYSDLLKLAEPLRLAPVETAHLLSAAGFTEVAERMQQAAEEKTEAGKTAVAPIPFQAIPALPYFVGRTRLMQQIEDILLTDHQTRACCLQGMAGAGKTALATQMAYRLRHCFADGVLWADVHRSDPMTILATFAHAYGEDVSRYDDLASRSQIVRQILADKQALIVLDDVWHGHALHTLLPPSTGGGAVIVTTRRHDLFDTAGMHHIEVGPFDKSGLVSLELFTRFLGQDAVAQHEDALLQIADLLGHLPLTVAIVASRLAFEPGWAPDGFLQRLQTTDGQLAELAYDDRSARVSFHTSFDLLTEDLQQFFSQLGVFEGRDFTPAAAAAVTDTSLPQTTDNLRKLYALSLCQLALSGNARLRYSLHPLLSKFAKETAVSATLITHARHRLVDYYLNYIDDHQTNTAQLAAETKNILAALMLAQSDNLDHAFRRGLAAFQPFLQEMGMQREVISLLREWNNR